MALPTSVPASHIASTGPPQCHAQHLGGHTALHRCHSCIRSPKLFLHANESSTPVHLLGRHECSETLQTQGLLRMWLTKGKRSSAANCPPNSDICCLSCRVLQQYQNDHHRFLRESWYLQNAFCLFSPLLPCNYKVDPNEIFCTWWTAKEALMPAPLTSLPCWYNLLTEGPIPCKAKDCLACGC